MQINLCPDTPAQGIIVHMYVFGCALGSICLFVRVCLCVSAHAKQSMRGYLKGMPDKVM